MGPAARDKPNDGIVDYPDEGSDDQRGSPERSPTPPINSHADHTKPTARQQARSAQIGDDITSTIKRRIKPVKIEAGSGITQINKLNDVNWANWREDMIRMLNFL